MKNTFLIIALFWLVQAKAQNYHNIVNYSLNGTPVYGVKIKTNIPFTPFSQMPTITITGMNYETAKNEPIFLTICYYVYSDNSDFYNPQNYFFLAPKVSSAGAYTPKIMLSNENGKVVLFIDDRSYYQRFTVSAFAQGLSEIPSWFQGWTIADEPINGTKTVEVAYENRLAGNVYLPGTGIWSKDGNVGIGTVTPSSSYKLSVNGSVRAKEVKVESGWADDVFEPDYLLMPLSETKKYIDKHKHLPGVMDAATVAKEGVDLGASNVVLLRKIEELTLHLIDQDRKNALQEHKIKKQEKLLARQGKSIRQLESHTPKNKLKKSIK